MNGQAQQDLSCGKWSVMGSKLSSGRSLAAGKFRGAIGLLIVAVVLLILRNLFPERPLDYTGPRALLDAIFAIGFLGLIIILASGIGTKVLRWLNISQLSGLTKHLFSLAIGLGVLAYGVLALGLAGFLNPTAVYIWLGFAALLTWRESAEIGNRLPAWLLRQRDAFADLGLPKKGVVILAGLILSFSLIQALAPPWGYDTLMYHLQAPRLFLEAGKITLLPDIWQANGPMTIEMLFTIGLIVKSDVFARIIHLTYFGLVVLGCFSLGQHLLGRAGGWLSAAILLGVPILPIWGSLAYADMALVLYGLLAIYALILWAEKGQNKILVLSGFMMGWAMGSKFTALGLFGVLAFWLVWRDRNEGDRFLLRGALIFGIPALLIAAPWYIKNWVLSGNPIYPFVFGGPLWDQERLGGILTYLIDGFGVGRSLWDFILLPFNIYAHPSSFGTSFALLDYPGFLFPLALLYPLARRYRNIDSIVVVTFGFCILWAFGSQQTRFLLPIYPLLAIICALVLLWLGRITSKKYYLRIVGIGLVGGFLMLTLVYQIFYLQGISPHPVVFGLESKRVFLSRAVFDYPAIQYAERALDDNIRILMMWDGQGYYCDQRCIPDPDQTRLYHLTKSNPQPKILASDLLGEGVTHILIDAEGLSFFSLHDPDGRHLRAAEYFFEKFAPLCGEEVFIDKSIYLYAITCLE